MASKLELIQLMITKINAQIDLSDIGETTTEEVSATDIVINEVYQIKTPGTTDFTLVGATNSSEDTIFTATAVGTGTGIVYKRQRKYHPNAAFVAVIFKKNDRGQFMVEPDPELYLNERLQGYKYIPVNFEDPELNKENIYKVAGDTNPIEAWTGAVGISMFIDVEDVENYTTIYNRINDFHENNMRNIVEVGTLFGSSRSIEYDSATIQDSVGRVLLNRTEYKEIGFAVNLNVTNPRILRSSRMRIQYKKSDGTWEEVNPLVKGNGYKKTFVDDTNSGVVIVKNQPELASRGISMSVVLDDSKELVNDVLDEVEQVTEGIIDKTYEFKIIREWPNGDTREFEISTSLGTYQETTDTNYDMLQLTFREV